MAGLVVQLEKVLAQRHALQNELAYRATHDELTGLPNRREFTEQLDRALRENPEGGTTVLFLDLDRFKAVNDSLGHGAGDTLLTVVAERLRSELRAEDTLARLGGDEFAVLLATPARDSDPLEAVTARLVAAVSLPVRLHGLDVQVGVSIGEATAGPGHPLEWLLKAADHAMYANKAMNVQQLDRRRAPSPAATGRR
jgi:diguanylate cyclase (GGDEF)-like protein